MEDIAFEYVCRINPLKDPAGNSIEFYPHKEYANADNKELHTYGKGPFCKFRIPNKLNGAGVYILEVDGEVKYVGECENLSNRYNTGYGQISPRNCFVGGQSTNCKINSYILERVKKGSSVDLLFCETDERFEVEKQLIEKYRPEWNSAKGKVIKVTKLKATNRNQEVSTKANISKYYPLEKYLDKQEVTEILLPVEDIEKIIGEPLPASAYKFAAWWGNNAKGHSHANAWLNAGWKVDKVKLGEHIVFRKET